jgi:hypothetical protein
MLPCVPFMAFSVADALDQAWKSKLGKINVTIYFIGIIIFLYIFFPMLVGLSISMTTYINLLSINFLFLIIIVAILNLQIFSPFLVSYYKNKKGPFPGPKH